MRIAFALCTVAVICGCAQGPAYRPAPDPTPTDALVYVYRPQATSGGNRVVLRDAYFYVNGVNVADISSQGYSWFHVPAGDYTLTMKWPADITLGLQNLDLRVRWQPGRKYYYRLDSSQFSTRLEWRLVPVAPERAPSELLSCRHQPAFGVEKLLDKLKEDRAILEEGRRKPGGDVSL